MKNEEPLHIIIWLVGRETKQSRQPFIPTLLLGTLLLSRGEFPSDITFFIGLPTVKKGGEIQFIIDVKN